MPGFATLTVASLQQWTVSQLWLLLAIGRALLDDILHIYHFCSSDRKLVAPSHVGCGQLLDLSARYGCSELCKILKHIKSV